MKTRIDDQAAVDDGAAHLDARRRARRRTPSADSARGRIQPQTPDDVLDVDDRVVNDFAERDDQPGDHHRVERAAAIAQDQRRRDAATAESR